MIHNKNKKSNINPNKKGKIIIIFGIFLLIGGSIVAGYQINSWQQKFIAAPNDSRKARIVAIYDSLKLNDSYQLVNSNVFGDKRVYEWDAGRTYSSARNYEHGANVDTTVAELKKAIETAGFTYFKEPYPGSAFTELHFKSAKGEYVRLNVSSKPRDDALRDAILMNTSDSVAIELDPNVGPSNVTIKVNLDDNNE